MDEYKLLLEKLERIELLALVGTKKTLTVKEAAAYIGKSANATYKLINGLTHYKSGKTIYIDKEELDRWMRQNIEVGDNDLKRLAAIHCDNNPFKIN